MTAPVTDAALLALDQLRMEADEPLLRGACVRAMANLRRATPPAAEPACICGYPDPEQRDPKCALHGDIVEPAPCEWSGGNPCYAPHHAEPAPAATDAEPVAYRYRWDFWPAEHWGAFIKVRKEHPRILANGGTRTVEPLYTAAQLAAAKLRGYDHGKVAGAVDGYRARMNDETNGGLADIERAAEARGRASAEVRRRRRRGSRWSATSCARSWRRRRKLRSRDSSRVARKKFALRAWHVPCPRCGAGMLRR